MNRSSAVVLSRSTYGSDDKLLVEIQSTGFFSHTPSHVSVDRGVASKVNFTSVFFDTVWPSMANALESIRS